MLGEAKQLAPQVADRLEELEKLFIEHGVVLAYLFGSQAEGTARPSSDIDIAVLLPPGTPREKCFDVRLNLTNALMDVFHKDDVDVVILNEAPPLLAHQVVKYGRIVYEDSATRPAVDFVVHTAARYSDTRPARELARQYLEEWIEERRKARLEQPREPYRW
jgi:predicted nucleotidyltransferase